MRKIRIRVARLAAACFGLALASPASAAIILENLGGGLGESAAALSGTGRGWMGVGFTVPAGQDYALDVLAAVIANNGPLNGSGRAGVVGTLLGDTAVNNVHMPDSNDILASFTAHLVGPWEVFTSATPVVLSGGTSYWFVVQGSKKQFIWNGSTGALSGIASGSYLGTLANGADVAAGVGIGTANGTGNPAIDIEGTPITTGVPEPAGAGLFALGAAGAWRVRRRRAAAQNLSATLARA